MILSALGKTALCHTSKQLICQHLDSGGIFAFPTDTVYGIGVKAGHSSGVDSVYQLKKRNENKPLIMMGFHKDQFRPFTSHPSLFDHTLFDELWPGPLTVLMPFRQETGLYFCQEAVDSIGFRIPNEPVMLDLLSSLNFPLLTTSANLSGKDPFPNGRSIQTWLISSNLKNCMVLDTGTLQNPPSTVISLSSSISFQLIRLGGLPIENISSYFSS